MCWSSGRKGSGKDGDGGSGETDDPSDEALERDAPGEIRGA